MLKSEKKAFNTGTSWKNKPNQLELLIDFIFCGAGCINWSGNNRTFPTTQQIILNSFFPCTVLCLFPYTVSRPCSLGICLNGGTCVDGPYTNSKYGFACVCQQGFDGIMCEKRLPDNFGERLAILWIGNYLQCSKSLCRKRAQFRIYDFTCRKWFLKQSARLTGKQSIFNNYWQKFLHDLIWSRHIQNEGPPWCENFFGAIASKKRKEYSNTCHQIFYELTATN